MSRDPLDFPDPTEFRPERWMQSVDKQGHRLPPRPEDFIFGFGRRYVSSWKIQHLTESEAKWVVHVPDRNGRNTSYVAFSRLSRIDVTHTCKAIRSCGIYDRCIQVW